jgi:hypothetical protein
MNLDGLFEDALLWQTSVSNLDLRRGSKHLVNAYICRKQRHL